MTVQLFIRPVDVLYLRGNRLFGGAGDHAEALMPPWPSLLSGAIRSRMLADAGADLGRVTDEMGSPAFPEPYASILGTPSEPGSFRIAGLGLAVRAASGRTLTLHPMPADVLVTRLDRGLERAQRTRNRLVDLLEGDAPVPPDPVEVRRLRPVAADELPGVATSSAMPLLLALHGEPGKPAGGYWLTGEGLERYLAGGVPEAGDLVHRRWLWETDSRLGIARSRTSFTAEEGRIYTTDTVAMADGVGFLATVGGCDGRDDVVPADGLLRLGGDGRAATVEPWPETEKAPPAPGPGEPFVVVLATPGLFPGGWLPPGVGGDGDELWLEVDGLRARLATAAVPRHHVISGWNLAAHAPKPAQGAVPAGAAYLFDRVEGDPSRYSAALWQAVETTLGAGWSTTWKQRQAEGFGNVWIGRWRAGGPR